MIFTAPSIKKYFSGTLVISSGEPLYDKNNGTYP